MLTLIMQRLLLSTLVVGSAVLFLLSSSFAAVISTTSETDMEVLTRGPIHEAFADVSVDETPSAPIISRPVPEPINEIPPEIRPEGNQVEWIPGYWSWDEDRNDFIWISGIWRDVPPGKQWIAGYWQAVDGGNRYISGYWTDSSQTATQYLPPPPQPLPAEPSSPPSAPDHVWMDGYWIWTSNSYAWQSGYWYEPNPGMIWIPAHYVWTPRGYVFVMGYWDYQPGSRGVIFAPLYYPRPVYRHRGYFYRPHVALNTDTVFMSLFIRRGYHHYYFGDYHDRRYEKRGFRPWSDRHATRYGHDPFYRNYRDHRLRESRGWKKNEFRQFDSPRNQRNEHGRQRYEPPRGHNLKQSPSPFSRGVGKLFGDVMDNSNRGQRQQLAPDQPDRRRELRSSPGVNSPVPSSRNKADRANKPHTEGRKVHAGSREPVKLNPFRVPTGTSKEERQENADRQNQGFQQQDQNNNQGRRLQPWHGRSNQRYSK